MLNSGVVRRVSSYTQPLGLARIHKIEWTRLANKSIDLDYFFEMSRLLCVLSCLALIHLIHVSMWF